MNRYFEYRMYKLIVLQFHRSYKINSSPNITTWTSFIGKTVNIWICYDFKLDISFLDPLLSFFIYWGRTVGKQCECVYIKTYIILSLNTNLENAFISWVQDGYYGAYLFTWPFVQSLERNFISADFYALIIQYNSSDIVESSLLSIGIYFWIQKYIKW